MKKEKKDIIYKKRLELIKKQRGKLKPSYVIEDARDKYSPLHKVFQWDDSKAGHQYRLFHARQLIARMVSVVVVEGKPVVMKSFFNIQHDKNDEQVYITLKESVTNPNYKDQVLNQLIKELEYVTDLMKTFKKYNG